ncbi:MAG: hypothetical protein C7B47_17185 [Sulfobacillus thermosulfidooxidans]|uniref:Uncharacterized protein n=1 Tax=Sulfobacillus thermosulfidooxidans TaxID=28034 RepID=A0A2T2WHH0_SULTH|nr:MAG: hypothetical protein C7B47_17185 [Sulfobacillus thermosulfidooxidans]
MGLDCYAVIIESAPESWFRDLEDDALPHGLCSFNANSFHGNDLDRLITTLTDLSLYTDTLIMPSDVQTIASALTNWVNEHPNTDWHDPDHPDADPIPFATLRVLAQWFRIAADNECALQTWW